MSELKTKVFEAIGAASMCWEPLPSNQVFESDKAKKIADDLWTEVEKLKQRIEKLEKVADASADYFSLNDLEDSHEQFWKAEQKVRWALKEYRGEK